MSRARAGGARSTRGQANLPALAVALLLVGGSVGVAVGLAGSAFASANTDPEDARLAASIADRLVAADGPFSVRANVLSKAATQNASADWLPADADARVTLDGRTVVSRGDPVGGATMRRIVLVAEPTTRRFEPTMEGPDVATLPRRATSATLALDPPAGVTITTVRADDRVVLHDPNGLDGAYDVALARYDTVRFQFDASSDLPAGSVEIAYRVETTTKAVLAVTVDA
ncbi:DUF7263 family protein [Halobacterium zhouii]|uniref:DUF7263 family protein n=1 Tax=Halobacterium zhouii TaxID=2902624 RepID=UPI001E54553A|nr:hypothetical protein [Halobacterium zhouii]